MRIHDFLLLLLLITISGCTALQDINNDAEIQEILLSASKQAQTPNLWIQDSTVYMLWTEEKKDSTHLYLSKIKNGKTSTPTLVSSGIDWFVNWADFSAIVVTDDKPAKVLVHWLQKSNSGTYDYDIHISQSIDDGATWSSSKILHNDGISAEHGFVSMANYDKDHYYASWLDGRNTKSLDPLNPDKKLPMSIRYGLINKRDLQIDDFLLDEKVCDCCQTSSVSFGDGILTAYRDRSDTEIRDIVIHKIDSDGSVMVFQSEDHWNISGCPVNGPSLASNTKWSGMTWYTAAQEPAVWLVYGKGASFDQKIRIDNGNPLGRVDIEVNQNTAYVTWLEMKDQRAEIQMKTINLETNQVINQKLISPTSPERRSGFPILKIANGYAYIAYTEVLTADHSTIRLKKIKL